MKSGLVQITPGWSCCRGRSRSPRPSPWKGRGTGRAGAPSNLLSVTSCDLARRRGKNLKLRIENSRETSNSKVGKGRGFIMDCLFFSPTDSYWVLQSPTECDRAMNGVMEDDESD